MRYIAYTSESAVQGLTSDGRPESLIAEGLLPPSALLSVAAMSCIPRINQLSFGGGCCDRSSRTPTERHILLKPIRLGFHRW
jgi:hypothetical protein